MLDNHTLCWHDRLDLPADDRRYPSHFEPCDVPVALVPRAAAVLQTTALREGVLNALIFIATVFGSHQLLAMVCARSNRIRRIVRSCPRPLIQNARVDYEALASEGLSYEELLAGLRKLGYSSPDGIRSATLEETGHISAIPLEREEPAHPTNGVFSSLPAQGKS
jgi:uncharacterized membrane protein YcaP (DUF421 family)